MKLTSVALLSILLTQPALATHIAPTNGKDPDLESPPASDTAPTVSVEPRGIYVDSNVLPLTPDKEATLAASLTTAGVDGVVLVFGWNGLEPTKGHYQWDTLDQWMSRAVSAGKNVNLSVRAGTNTPAWLFKPAPAGAGATKLDFSITRKGGGSTGVCEPESIAAPWDSTFLAQWDSLLVHLAAHLKSAGTYGNVALLRLTGINRDTDELHLPAETAQSTGLSCVSDAVTAWQQAGYRPSLVLQGWDAITSSFKKSFPEKYFSAAIIAVTNPFPPIAEDGSVMTVASHESLGVSQNLPLLTLASRKFPGRLIIQNNSLYITEPAEPQTIHAAEALGTMLAFQTNEDLASTYGGAACGARGDTTACTPTTFLTMLETGIYPLGKTDTLRARYIEVFAANVNAFPADIWQAHLELLAPAALANVDIALGTPIQLFHPGKTDALGMTGVPDMHTAIVQQPDSSYRLWIAGRFNSDSVEGATGLITTKDFLSYAPVGNSKTAEVVLAPSCRPGSLSCWNNFDADYAGADLVFPAANGKDLLMLYHGQTKYYGVRPPNRQTDPSWCEIGLARSSDNGVTWTGRVPVVSGRDVKPDSIPSPGIYGAVELGAILSGGFIYAFYSYFPTPHAPDDGPPTIQVARSPIGADGAPGTWTKYYNGAFGSEPGLGGLGSPVVPSISGATRPAQPWPVFNTFLDAYVLLFLCEEGWYFSTSTDLITWSAPKQFFQAPAKEFTAGQPTDENVIMVTPGYPGQVIGRTGYVLYAHTPAWGDSAHELWMRPFTFDALPTDVTPATSPLPAAIALLQNYPNPFNPSTTIGYRVPSPGSVMVRLAVYDVLGREVAVLVNGKKDPGSYSVTWDASGRSSGVYFCRIEVQPLYVTGGQISMKGSGVLVKTEKMMLIK